MGGGLNRAGVQMRVPVQAEARRLPTLPSAGDDSAATMHLLLVRQQPGTTMPRGEVWENRDKREDTFVQKSAGKQET